MIKEFLIFLILLLQINADNSTAYDKCLKQGQLGFIYKPCGSTRGREGVQEISTLLIKPI